VGTLLTTDDRALRACVLGFKELDATYRRELNKATRTVLGPEFVRAVAAHGRTNLDTRVLVAGAKVAGGNPPVLVAGSSRRRMRGGMVPDRDAAAVEFGTLDRNHRTTYQRQGAKVTRRTRRQLPARVKSGRVVMPAVADVVPKVTSMWVQQFVRLVYEAAGES
jgi:hypothetical protein